MGDTSNAILIVPDVHAPYHDQRAWELLLRVRDELKPGRIICTGDFFDFYAVSSHRKDPRRAQMLRDEIAIAGKMMKELSPDVFIMGNHEDRLERYLCDYAPALMGLVGFEELVMAPTLVQYKDFYQLGKVAFTHDLDYTGPYVAQRALSDAQHSIVVGHAHRLSMCVEGDINGTPKVSACFGWLGDADKADYMHRLKAKRQWSLGFGIGYQQEDGVVFLEPVPIVDYSCKVGSLIVKG
jgi:predicted phosphodiesterase